VAWTVTPLIPKLMDYFLSCSAQEARYCIELLANATELQENAETVSSHKFAEKIDATLVGALLLSRFQARYMSI